MCTWLPWRNLPPQTQKNVSRRLPHLLVLSCAVEVMYNSAMSLGGLVSCSQTQSFGRAESEIKCWSGYSRLLIGCYVYNGGGA